MRSLSSKKRSVENKTDWIQTMIDYHKDGMLHVVSMNNESNMICPDWHARMLEILDIVAGDCHDRARCRQ